MGRPDIEVVQLWADCRIKGKKASFPEKSMDRCDRPSHNLHGSHPRKSKRRENCHPLQQLREVSEPNPPSNR